MKVDQPFLSTKILRWQPSLCCPTLVHCSVLHLHKDVKMAVWLFLVMLTAFAASAEDLSGKRFNFPVETDTDYVKLIPSSEDFGKATLCLRFMTDRIKDYALFSVATASKENAFLLMKDTKDDGRDVMRFYIDDERLEYEGLEFPLNKWNSLCATWDSDTDLTQIWVNGMPTVTKYVDGPAISSPFIVIGQDQDSVGGGFQTKQTYVGWICDLHLWDHVITPCEIKDFMDGKPFTVNKNPPGNLLNWEDLTYEITGTVLVEDKDKDLTCHGK